MGLAPENSFIRLRGVRQNNLKNIDLDLPHNALIVITGLSGAGKSSLAFETLFAEGQRRYIETFGPYARQFLDRMDKPQADRIENIPPAIAITHRNTVRSSRSTVGTLTEICDYMRVVWLRLAKLHCRSCGRIVERETPDVIWESLRSKRLEEVIVTFVLPLSQKLSVDETVALIERQGYQRVWWKGQVRRLSEWAEDVSGRVPAGIEIVQDRIRVQGDNYARFVEAVEQAYRFGKGLLQIRPLRPNSGDEPLIFSNRLHCAHCDIEYQEPMIGLFSFNHPVGACPRCRGFGRTIEIDYRLAIPDPSRTLRDCPIEPWRSGLGRECYYDMLRVCRERGIPLDVPFAALDHEHQRFIIEGDPDYGVDEEHEWPKCWYGVKGYFDWLETKKYKVNVRVLLSKYRVYKTCSFCNGSRFRPEALLYRIGARAKAEERLFGEAGITIADFYSLDIPTALDVVRALQTRFVSEAQRKDPAWISLEEVRRRLEYLIDVGLEYLTLDRPARTLSGGETERVTLAAALGTELVNTLYVLDEPTVGLHPRDVNRLIRVLKRLRDLENTVVVVEHDLEVVEAADHVVELGPGHGREGGHVVFQGSVDELRKDCSCWTGLYLSGKRSINVSERRPVRDCPDVRWLIVQGANKHNLKDLTVRIPLNRFVCITGVSGSGKSTLVRDVLVPALSLRLYGQVAREFQDRDVDVEEDELDLGGLPPQEAVADIEGWQAIRHVTWIDQSPVGRTPRSTPAVYVEAFDPLRELFAQTEQAKALGLNSGSFSFNSGSGRCPRCRGLGYEHIEMQFLSDVYVQCPDCKGTRYRPEVLSVRISIPGLKKGWNIADFLQATVREAIEVLNRLLPNALVKQVLDRLRCLELAGLGYLQMGQPLNTLSGGENERIKLARHLAQSGALAHANLQDEPYLFLLDEPTTGLHLEDIAVLLNLFQLLVEQGHSVVVIEHNPYLIQCADWVIDLGPEGGAKGGQIVCEGTPEDVAGCPISYTGAALRQIWSKRSTLDPLEAAAKS